MIGKFYHLKDVQKYDLQLAFIYTSHFLGMTQLEMMVLESCTCITHRNFETRYFNSKFKPVIFQVVM